MIPIVVPERKQAQQETNYIASVQTGMNAKAVIRYHDWTADDINRVLGPARISEQTQMHAEEDPVTYGLGFRITTRSSCQVPTAINRMPPKPASSFND